MYFYFHGPFFAEELYFHTPILRRTIQSYCIEKSAWHHFRLTLAPQQWIKMTKLNSFGLYV